ncbi:MAG: hypothetical protein ACE5G3_09130, partial [Gammaproteobacteria bacterium]
MRKVLGIGLLCAALAPLPGAAADAWYDGLYVGSGVGAARLEADLPDLGLLPRNSAGIPESIESTDFKKTALTGKFFVGYRPFKYLGIEVGFAKLNDVSRQYCFVDTSGECTETRGTPIPPTSSTATTSSAWTVELDT